MTLTLPSRGCFWSFCHNLHSLNTIKILKLFLGLGHSGHPCDQIHMGIGPNHALFSEQWGFKVGRGVIMTVEGRVNLYLTWLSIFDRTAFLPWLSIWPNFLFDLTAYLTPDSLKFECFTVFMKLNSIISQNHINDVLRKAFKKTWNFTYIQ